MLEWFERRYLQFSFLFSVLSFQLSARRILKTEN